MENSYFKNYPLPNKNFIKKAPHEMKPATPVAQDEELPKQIAPRIMEQSYIENIIRLNQGKMANFYMTFTDSAEWRNKVFSGIIETAGRDHIIVKDPNNGLYYLLLLIYLDYVTFEEPIEYDPRFARP